MPTNAANARIFGGDLDSVWLAPLGTPLPTDVNQALNGAFDDVGWLSDDGIGEETTGSKTKFRGHQGMAVIRTRMTETGTEYTFVAAERKALTLGLRYDERVIGASASGARQVTRGPGQKVAARAAVIDFYDADDATVRERLAIPRFEIVPDGNSTFKADEITYLPFRGEIIGQYQHWSNTPTPKVAWTLNITGAPTGGTFTLFLNGYATSPIAYNAANSAIAAALNALSGVTGLANITVSGTGPFTITLPSAAMLSANSSGLTGGSAPLAVVS